MSGRADGKVDAVGMPAGDDDADTEEVNVSEFMEQLKTLASKEPALGAIVWMMDKLSKRIDQQAKPEPKEAQVIPMIRQKGLDTVTVYEGKFEELDQWRSKLFGFLGEGEWFTELLKWGERQTEEINEAMLQAYGTEKGVPAVKWSKQFHAVLLAKTEKNAMSLVENVDDNNGVRAWQRLSEWYGKIHPQQRRRLLEMLLRPKTAKDTEGIEGIVVQQELWEKVLRKYMRCTKKELPDDVLVVGYMAMLPPALYDKIISQKEEMTTLKEVQEYVNQQVRARRNEKELSFSMALEAEKTGGTDTGTDEESKPKIDKR